MPIYEYACGACGQTIEVIHGMSAAVPATHEGCGGELRRVTSTAVTRTKGNDGATDTTHTSMLRFQENRTLAAEKARKKR